MEQDEITAEAQKLFDNTMKEVDNTRKDLARRMAGAGMTSEYYMIVDNMSQIVTGTATTYRCWPELKLKGESDGG